MRKFSAGHSPQAPRHHAGPTPGRPRPQPSAARTIFVVGCRWSGTVASLVCPKRAPTDPGRVSEGFVWARVAAPSEHQWLASLPGLRPPTPFHRPLYWDVRSKRGDVALSYRGHHGLGLSREA